MGIKLAANRADFVFQVDGGPVDKLRVVEFSGYEEVSSPFRYRLDLASKDGSIDFKGVVGKPGLLTIEGREAKRFVHGIVTRFEQGSRGKDWSRYTVDLVPEIMLLSHRAKCRIYQNEKTQDIVKKVLEEGGLAKDRFRFSLKGTYAPREYCVQYRESDLDFISRLLEDEGIFYFFEHKKDGHVLVMTDSPEGTGPIEGNATVLYHPPTGEVPDKDHVLSFRFSEEIRSGKAMLRDFNYMKPSMKLEATEKAKSNAELEVYDYPGGSLEPDDDGKRLAALAKARMEGFQATRAAGHGSASTARFLPGYRMTLDKHSRKDFNIEYLLVRVEHTGAQPQAMEEAVAAAQKKGATYENSFMCISAKVPFRAERRTPKPVVKGIQTATVTGPSGEKLHMDEHGRAKVMFHWDREGKKDDKCTCWIRVSQGYAGATHGIQFPPLIGDEVVVDFLEGDPDRPLIVGRVYNGEAKPPLKPEDRIQNVILTPYQHRLIFDDKNMSITLSTKEGQTFHLGDAEQDSDFGHNIKLTTTDGHQIEMANGDQRKGVAIQTVAQHSIELRDDPSPGLFLVDKSGDLSVQLDSENQTIGIVNSAAKEITIKCAGGTINVEAAEINIKAENKVAISAKAEISLDAAEVRIEGKSSVEAKAAQVKIEGQATLEAKGGATAKFEGGSMAELKGGAVTSISGGIVKIN